MSREGNSDTRGKGTFVWRGLVPQSPTIMEGKKRRQLIPGVREERTGSGQEGSCGVGSVGATVGI